MSDIVVKLADKFEPEPSTKSEEIQANIEVPCEEWNNKDHAIMEINLEYEYMKAQLDEAQLQIEKDIEIINKKSDTVEIQTELSGDLIELKIHKEVVKERDAGKAEIERLKREMEKRDIENEQMRL